MHMTLHRCHGRQSSWRAPLRETWAPRGMAAFLPCWICEPMSPCKRLALLERCLVTDHAHAPPWSRVHKNALH